MTGISNEILTPVVVFGSAQAALEAVRKIADAYKQLGTAVTVAEVAAAADLPELVVAGSAITAAAYLGWAGGCLINAGLTVMQISEAGIDPADVGLA
jgi:hypothetical protein